mmetsp:Transcript_15303/g.43764  ORF Transcript_15303/g.43764 Transcript_15303/m.43764 type:complete len:306 (+) Transcript_15303:253-1170(+)
MAQHHGVAGLALSLVGAARRGSGRCEPDLSHEQEGIDAPVDVRVVCDLGVLRPDDLPCLRHEAELGNVDLDDGAFRDDSQGGVQLGLRVLFHAHHVEAEGHLQFRVGDVRLLEPERGGPDVALVLGWLPCEVVADKGDLVDDALPSLLLPLPGAEDLEHLVLCHGLHLRDWHLPLPGLLLPLLLDHVGQHLRPPHLLAVEEVRRHGAGLGLVVVRGLRVLLLVGLDRLLHRRLLHIPLLGEELRLDAAQLLGRLRELVRLARLLLSQALRMIKSFPESAYRFLNVLILRHDAKAVDVLFKDNVSS